MAFAVTCNNRPTAYVLAALLKTLGLVERHVYAGRLFLLPPSKEGSIGSNSAFTGRGISQLISLSDRGYLTIFVKFTMLVPTSCMRRRDHFKEGRQGSASLRSTLCQ